MPLIRKSFAEALTFSRASEGTFTGSNGLMQTAAAGVPRFDYDPVTLAPKGILLEGGAINLIPYPTRFDNAAWFKVNLVVTPDAVSSPIEGVMAQKIAATSIDDLHYFHGPDAEIVSGNRYTLSILCKSAGLPWFRLAFHTDRFDPVNRYAYFNTNNGLLGTVKPGVTARVDQLADGWFLFSITATAISSGNGSPGRFALGSTDDDLTFLGDGVAGVYVAAAQCEAGDYPSSRILTGTRERDVLTVNSDLFQGAYRRDQGAIAVTFRNQSTGIGVNGSSKFDVIYDIDSAAETLSDISIIASAGWSGVDSRVRVGGTVEAQINGPVGLGSGLRHTHVLAYSADNLFSSLNGSAPLSDGPIALPPTPDRLSLGSGQGGTESFCNVHLEEVKYLPVSVDPALIPSMGRDETRASIWGSSSAELGGPEFINAMATVGVSGYSGGRSGEWSDQIFARLGAIPVNLAFPANTIPASGPALVTAANWNGGSSSLLAFTGTVGGVAGTLAWSAGDASLVFTRTASGSAVALGGPAAMGPTVGPTYRNAICALWAGKNNITNGDAISRVIAQTEAAAEWLYPAKTRFLVIGHHVNSGADSTQKANIATVNAAHAAKFGAQFVDLQSWLMSPQVWIDTGLTPTVDDDAAQAAGELPPSLRRDAIHMADVTEAALMQKVVLPRMQALWRL